MFAHIHPEATKINLTFVKTFFCFWRITRLLFTLVENVCIHYNRFRIHILNGILRLWARYTLNHFLSCLVTLLVFAAIYFSTTCNLSIIFLSPSKTGFCL